MTYRNFQDALRARFKGYAIEFQCNEAAYSAAIITEDVPRLVTMMAQSSPYTDRVRLFWHGTFVGFLD